MRRFTLPAVAVIATLGLTGCGGATNSAGESLEASKCTNPVASGSVSAKLTTETAFGEVPDDVKVTPGTTVSRTQATLLNADAQLDDGQRRAANGDVIGVDLLVIDPATGKTVMQSESFGSDRAGEALAVYEADENTPVTLGAALRCAAVGERYAVAFGATDAQYVAGNLPVTPGQGVVVIADVKSIGKLDEQGAARALPNGFPAVTVDSNGTPGVVIPPNSPPEGIRVAERYVGNGREVTGDDTLVIQAQIVNWDGTVQGDAWSQGPQIFPPVEQNQIEWRKDLNGMREGSLAVVLEPVPESESVNIIIVKILTATG